MAIGYRDLGRYEEEVGLDEETLSTRERVLGPEHPDTITSRNNLAQTVRDARRGPPQHSFRPPSLQRHCTVRK